jgi:dihydrodipicolinate synthase/N-acetylneuraminate lyase
VSNPWKGVFPAVTTQFKKDQSLDLVATAAHLERIIDSGVDGLVMLGSLGENNVLLPSEKLEVLKMAKEVAKGRVPVLSGVSELSTGMAISYVREAEALGIDGFMVLPALIYPADEQEVITHFRAVAAETKLPIIIYNNPIAYKIDISPKGMLALSDVPNFVAIKESCGDTRRFIDLRNTVGDRYELFCGVDDLAFECVALGATGWIAGIGIAYLEENAKLWQLMMEGKWVEARKLYEWYMPLLHLDVGPKFVQKIKLAIQENGMGSEWVRMPRMPLSGAEREEVLKVIAEANANRPKLS